MDLVLHILLLVCKNCRSFSYSKANLDLDSASPALIYMRWQLRYSKSGSNESSWLLVVRIAVGDGACNLL